MTMVNESLVIQNGNKLIGLVHPDMDEAEALGCSVQELQDVMEQNRKELNGLLPSSCKLASIKLHETEFEKTPNKSIKRYLYKNIV